MGEKNEHVRQVRRKNISHFDRKKVIIGEKPKQMLLAKISDMISRESSGVQN